MGLRGLLQGYLHFLLMGGTLVDEFEEIRDEQW
jgi:hypothetical protein